jgi:hypothetical protein
VSSAVNVSKDVIMSGDVGVQVLLVLVALLIGVIAALLAGLLSRIGGAHLTAAILRGGVAFGGTVTFVMMLMNAIGLL